jgi:hypothetical protein
MMKMRRKMKKIELKNLAEYFGRRLPANRITERETRIAVVRLYGSLALAYKGVTDEIEEIRKGLVGDHEPDVRKWAQLEQKAKDEKATKKEREAAKKEADSMKECVRINNDYEQAVTALLSEDIEVEVKKVPLEVLYEALCDCDFPNLDPSIPVGELAQMFAPVIE